jgi:hypothetical protein
VSLNEWCDEPVATVLAAAAARKVAMTTRALDESGAREGKVHESADGRLRVWQCALQHVAEPAGACAVVYDKDAFHAVAPAQRSGFADVSVAALRDGGVYVLEAKDKGALPADADERATFLATGPPFHMSREIVDEFFANETRGLEVVDFKPSFYSQPGDAGWKQALFAMKKKKKKTTTKAAAK